MCSEPTSSDSLSSEIDERLAVAKALLQCLEPEAKIKLIQAIRAHCPQFEELLFPSELKKEE